MTPSSLPAGAAGAIVDIFDRPQRAHEVEFVGGDGATLAIVTVLPAQVRRA